MSYIFAVILTFSVHPKAAGEFAWVYDHCNLDIPTVSYRQYVRWSREKSGLSKGQFEMDRDHHYDVMKKLAKKLGKKKVCGMYKRIVDTTNF